MRAAIVLLMALAGCAAAPTRQMLEYNAYVSENLPRAERGEVKWSEYYTGLYARASDAGAPGDVLLRMNELIRSAQQREAGAITKEEFDYRRRAIKAEQQIASQRAAERDAAKRSAATADNIAMMAAGVQMMQASGPHTLPQSAPAVASPSSIMGFLQGQSVSGFLRYCRYSNGVVTTLASTTLCPMNTQ